ncbi:MAG: carboxy terminal-processing peptidase [Mariniblastus sp.]|nr:carboxy terminal-processing peptidase [Mariniblastus sp.]MDG2182854.1 carboxy terminal-processing peptidase [Mariniblastus sp.]
MLSFKFTPLKTRFSVLAVALVCVAVTISHAQDSATTTQSSSDKLISKTVSRIVAKLMQDDHLSKRKLDDTMSSRAFDMFIKNLDPTKSYFLQSDIDEFSKWKTELDDQMLKGEFLAAFEVFDRFLQRVDERTDLAAELIDEDHDFTIDEEMITDPKLLSFAKNDAEARDNWRKRIKYSLLVLRGDANDEKADGDKDKTVKKNDDPKDRLRKRYSSFARRMHQIDAEDIVERYITAITTSFDPHTTYLSKGTFENFLIQMGLELEGIGATLSLMDEGYTVIKAIVPGGAAFTQGGLKVEDKIVAVGQGEEDGSRAYDKLFREHGGGFVECTGMKLDDVVGMIRGKAGTVVRLQVMSENESELHTVEIVREKIKLEDSAAHGEVFEEGSQKIGVIELPSFYANMGGGGGRSTTTDVKKILDDFNSKDVDALVLDLRMNGGGSLREAIDCTGLFIDIGPVVQVKDPYGTIQKLNDENGGTAWDKPMVVLTSKFSASASEILAGAIQDYGRGLVIGDTTTHGKGTVQSLVNLNQILFSRIKNPPNEFGALKITTQQFYRPNGDSTQKRGVLSDLVLPSISDNMDNIGEADLDYPVKFDRVPEASFAKLKMNRQDITSALRTKSKERIDSSDEFQKEIIKINKYIELKNEKTVSLNEAKFIARRKELNAEKEDEKTIEKQMLPSNDIERNFYLDEVLRITADYVEMLNQKQLSLR